MPADQLTAARAVAADPPLSFGQQQLWFLAALQPDSPVYNVPGATRLRGPLDVQAMEWTLNQLVARHASLRAGFPAVDGVPVQRVAAEARLALPVDDLAGSPPGDRAAAVGAAIRAESARPFVLAEPPLLRARLLRIDADDHVLVLTLHHIVFDGVSEEVLFDELSALYAARVAGSPPPAPPSGAAYGDFVAWQRERQALGHLDADLAYWRRRLAGAPRLLELPTDRPRPRVLGSGGRLHRFSLPAGVPEEVWARSRQWRVTPFMTLLTAFAACLGRWTGAADVVIGTPVAGRTRPEFESTIGLFANTLALRVDLAGDPSFAMLTGRVRAAALEAYRHQEAPFERVVDAVQPERSLGHNPLFQVMFTAVSRAQALPALPGVRASALELGTATAKFDLSLSIAASTGRLEYATDLFDGATAARMARHYRTLLGAALAEPEAPLSALEMLPPGERRLVQVEWSDGGRAETGGRELHDLLAEGAAAPGAEAVVCGNRRLTHGELHRRANRLAHHLRALGVRAEDRVAVCVERTPDVVVALLGVLKAGAAYVPVDPSQPAARVAYLLRDARAAVLLTHAALRDRLPVTAATVVELDASDSPVAHCREDEPPPAAAPGNLAYVLYTSGSTGSPKGVMIERRSLADHVAVIGDRYGLRPDDAVLQFASTGFDVSIEQILPPLVRGARVVLREREVWGPGELLGRLRDEGVTVADLTPAYWHLLVEELAADPPTGWPLRLLSVGGDVVSPDDAIAWFRAAEGTALLDTYGPTEATITCAVAEVRPGSPPGARLPIGRPVPNATVYVLDRDLRPAPVGVPGELCVAGVRVARGYLGRAALTAERFVPDPFGGEGGRLYRTGDRVRWLADGQLDFLGRLDRQVEVRGVRTEPGEIEARLVAHPGVAAAVVVARPGPGGEPVLVAYCALAAGAAPVPEGELRAHLRRHLPEHHLPAAVAWLDALPLTPGGKIDHGALPPPPAPAPTSARPGEWSPSGELEKRIADLWRELLGLDAVGVHQSFFDLGGHSLLLVRLQVRLARALGRPIPMLALFDHPTVRSLAAYLATGDGPPPAESPDEPPAGRLAGRARMRKLRRLQREDDR
ncbi:MAG TPA: amino acid adenylation domain-containing protein [Candidatus Dormibacteraeota bacterium]|nr:amino acid adenylation domain-containing protein [Candidatus Dormibacteraeota bacterium]